MPLSESAKSSLANLKLNQLKGELRALQSDRRNPSRLYAEINRRASIAVESLQALLKLMERAGSLNERIAEKEKQIANFKQEAATQSATTRKNNIKKELMREKARLLKELCISEDDAEKLLEQLESANQ